MPALYRDLAENEKRYYKLLETLPLIVYSAESTPPYVPLYVSRGIESLGYTREEWLEVPDRWIRSIHPEDLDRVLAESERAFATSQPLELEYRIFARDGSVVWIHDRGSFILDEDGVAVQWRGVMVDVTERKTAELALLESEERYRKLIESSPDAVVVHSEGLVVFGNPAAAAMLRAPSPEALIGLSVRSLVHPDWRACAAARIAAIIDTGKPAPPMEEVLLAMDGTAVEAEVTGSAITWQGRRAIQVLARDVSVRRRSEEAVRHAEEQLRHAQRLETVGRLAGGIAHDFNNILTIITSHAGFLMDAAANRPDLLSEVEQIREAAGRAADLTRQLLAFGRRQVLQPTVMDANHLVCDTLRLMRRVISESIVIDTTLSRDALLVNADRGQFAQVLTNLIMNARDAMPSGGILDVRTDIVEAEAQIDAAGETATAGTYVRIGVEDSGSGMDAATLARAFEPFFTTKPTGQGNGLGLSSVHGIVKQSGGFLTIDSVVGRGTKIRVHLPYMERS